MFPLICSLLEVSMVNSSSMPSSTIATRLSSSSATLMSIFFFIPQTFVGAISYPSLCAGHAWALGLLGVLLWAVLPLVVYYGEVYVRKCSILPGLCQYTFHVCWHLGVLMAGHIQLGPHDSPSGAKNRSTRPIPAEGVDR